MSNATATQPLAVTPIRHRWVIYTIVGAVLAFVAVLAFQGLDSAPAETGLTRAQQAEADRLTGLAEHYATRVAEVPAVAPPGENIDPHVSPEISRVPVSPIDPHVSPEISRIAPD